MRPPMIEANRSSFYGIHYRLTKDGLALRDKLREGEA